jgi:ubiquinone biosynthesis UbiH/UbiF/VisC/COQ6 family hydroxylase
MQTDIIIVGAGPVGLCLARRLSGHQLRITVIEQHGLADLAQPQFDGREIALTQKSVEIMKHLGLWHLIDAEARSPLRAARILDGSSSFALAIGHELGPYSELGWLISNHRIRQAAYVAMQAALARNGDITMLAGAEVVAIETDASSARVTLASGQQIAARLAIAADSRWSPTRKMMGIAAEMHDFGKTMLTCCMTHEQPHHHAAWEWFGYAQTLALLPMNPAPGTTAHRSSVVLTLTGPEIEKLIHLDHAEFNRQIEQRFESRLGKMTLVSTRHAYPLLSVYPKRLVGRRFATVGDAAVGMHPVTAHGFNFGLLSIEALAQAVLAAHRHGHDIADPTLLRRYEQQHRRATRPLYLMTRAITELYTQDAPAAKLLRKIILHAGERLTPFKRAIAASLAGR